MTKMLRKGTIPGFYTFVLTTLALIFMILPAVVFGPAWGCFSGIALIMMCLSTMRYTMLERNQLIESMKEVPGFRWQEEINEKEKNEQT